MFFALVIVHHNEAWSAMIRTLWSVITQSPKALIKEIILVDDFSDKTYLGEKFDKFIQEMKRSTLQIILLKTPNRVGLIQARLLGASKATVN